jgi:diaminohydroxyphosphoribosylaminopyrimidine deaminase/5-amino-6-(5-phosphoribosylamino)uracil reductase
MEQSMHIPFMLRALELARRGGRDVRPNPQVGAVIVRDGRIIGEGYHQRYGHAHAEANALLSAREPTEGATMYCTLEPCCYRDDSKHQPPCTEAIIEAGIRTVVVAQIDPNPRVAGAGVAQLRSAGVDVLVGVLAESAVLLNREFNSRMVSGRPFVHLKWAQSIDGKLATSCGDSKWITDDAARARAHRMRSENDAVLVGVGTVSADNPRLTVRHRHTAVQPRPVVIDPALRIREDSVLVSERAGELILLATTAADSRRASRLESRGVTVLSLPGDSRGVIAVTDVVAALSRYGIDSVLVEGGARVLGAFLLAGVYDRISVFTAPTVLGTGLSPGGRDDGRWASNRPWSRGFERVADADRLVDVAVERIGDQVLHDGYSRRWLDGLTDGGARGGADDAHAAFVDSHAAHSTAAGGRTKEVPDVYRTR